MWRREDEEEAGRAAIKRAIRALRRRHLIEEGAHAPAILALQRGPFASQGLEWKEKAENLELELQQCYKAQSRLSEQLVAEVSECRTSKALLQEKEATVIDLQNELTQAREECIKLKEDLDKKLKALELALSENQALRVKLEEQILKARHTEAENKSLIERMMLDKMKDAERLNEINAMYQDLMDRLKVSNIEQLARQQVDGVVRRSELGLDNYVESPIPSTCKHVIHAHIGGCGSIAFQNNSNKLISGGQDHKVKVWDSVSGLVSSTLHGCVGSVLDLTVSHDNRLVIAACSSNNLYALELASGRSRHTLSGHRDKVCAVDAPKIPSRYLVSAAYDHTIKLWDLNSGFCVNTIMSNSNCNALCYSIDGLTICSGHLDGNLRLWDSRTGKFINEVVGHSNAITSICLSRSGNVVLTSGRDNMHNLYDLRSLEVCETFKVNGNQLASNWSRSCISTDDHYVAVGSADGSVHVWSRLKKDLVATLKGHTAPVLSCSWNGQGQPLASADKSGTVCIWA
uniref:Protein tipD n=1 Tax=Anthurium amnicola TaxID=1678845 RepID=A0A1D1YCR5_9ARAE